MFPKISIEVFNVTQNMIKTADYFSEFKYIIARKLTLTKRDYL